MALAGAWRAAKQRPAIPTTQQEPDGAGQKQKKKNRKKKRKAKKDTKMEL